MKNLLALVLGCLVSLAAHAQSTLVEWHQSGDAPSSMEPGDPPEGDGGDLTFYATRGDFDGTFSPASQICEDYEDTNITPGGLTGYPAPFDSSTNNAEIPAGSIAEGLVIQDNPLNDAGGGSPAGLVAVGAGAAGNPSNLVVANTFVDSLDLLFTTGPTSVAMDVFVFTAADNVTVTFFDDTDAVIGSTVVAANSTTGGFVGASSPTPIARVNLVATNQAGTGAEGGDDICFTGTTPGSATFLTSKDFNDDNTAEVEVTLSCNTGLPLEQTTSISEGNPVDFVIGDFEPGTLDCEITEVVPEGYTASYDNSAETSETGCAYPDIIGDPHTCEITNTLDPVEVEVTKVWIDENPQFNAQNVASANWCCNNVFDGGEGFIPLCGASGFLNFNGNPDTDTFEVFPDWEDGTTCSIDEVNLLESGVEVDDSECQGLTVFPGGGASCTIYNTRLYEGIPTLSQYGLGLLALLMLGVGFVAFRRVI